MATPDYRAAVEHISALADDRAYRLTINGNQIGAKKLRQSAETVRLLVEEVERLRVHVACWQDWPEEARRQVTCLRIENERLRAKVAELESTLADEEAAHQESLEQLWWNSLTDAEKSEAIKKAGL